MQHLALEPPQLGCFVRRTVPADDDRVFLCILLVCCGVCICDGALPPRRSCCCVVCDKEGTASGPAKLNTTAQTFLCPYVCMIV